MKADYIAEVEGSKQQRYERARVILTIDRAEAIKLIAKLSAGLASGKVTRYGVKWSTPPEIYLRTTVNDKFFADVYFSIDITKGYLNGDIIKEEDKS
jgi:hypothetical protein